MKDSKGRDLEVGQEVVYIKAWWGSKYSLETGTITRVMPKFSDITGAVGRVSNERIMIL